MMGEIREAKILRIGSGNLTGFNEVGVNTQQIGSAIQIYPTLNTNTFVRYYWDSADKRSAHREWVELHGHRGQLDYQPTRFYR